MTLLIDTNVILDVLAERAPFDVPARDLWAAAERDKIAAVVSAVSFATVYYIARKQHGRDRAREACETVARVFGVATVTRRS